MSNLNVYVKVQFKSLFSESAQSFWSVYQSNM